MKIKLFSIVIFAFNMAIAQENEIGVKDLEVPTAPGFSLLDESPTNIETINTPTAFAFNVYNSFTGNDNGFPKNYAIEFTPYWFVKDKNSSFLKYAGINETRFYTDDERIIKNKQLIFSSITRASFSFAYVNKNDTLTAKAINNISLGMRTTLVKIRSNDDVKKIRSAYKKNLLILGEDVTAATLQVANIDPGSKEYTIKYNEALEKILHERQSKNVDSISIDSLLKSKPVFNLDVAVAYSRFYLENDFDNNHFGRFGTWLTAKYAPVFFDRCFNFYFVARYIRDGTFQNSDGSYAKTDNYDLGSKIELELNKFSLSYEYINRSGDIKTYRSSGLLKYKINSKLYLTGAFGKNFGVRDDLVSILGINWGFEAGTEKIKK